MTPPEIFFDLETKRLAEEVGGWEFKALMGLACAVTWNSLTQEFQHFLEGEAAKLVDTLAGAHRVIGFNLKQFDYAVLQPYTEVKLSQLPTLDLLEVIHQALGFRLSLKALATATLGISKPADGVQAVKWFRQGKIDQVLAYCQEDVRLTKELYEFGRHHGYLKYRDAVRGESRVPVAW